MSRSYRKTPICGMTTAASDKAFKKAEHKRARRAVSACDQPPAGKSFGNPWGHQKMESSGSTQSVFLKSCGSKSDGEVSGLERPA